MWLLGRSSDSDSGKQEKLNPTQKLKEYFELGKDAIERGHAADQAGNTQGAVTCYRLALQIVYEGLSLQVPSIGLSAKADNVANWREQMNAWQLRIQDRVRDLESRGLSSPRPPPPPLTDLLRVPSLTRSRSAGSASSTPLGPSLVLVPKAAAAAAARPRSGAPVPTAAAAGRAQGSRHPASAAAVAGGVAAAVGAAAGRAAVSKEEGRLREMIEAEILDRAPTVTFDDVADLATAKRALQEAVILPSLRADIFTGLRAPVRGILLYGPPGNGKTMLAKALAHESQATFFNISAASLTSKWVGEGEKLVRALFAIAAERQPSIIFMDEIDSLLSSRSANEHDAARRLKTEFLVQFDGVAADSTARVVIIGATNRPQELDDAVRRRLVKRIFIPLPDADGRIQILKHLLKSAGPGGGAVALSGSDINKVVKATDGYSASDLTALCKEAALGPVRELGPAIASIKLERIRPIKLSDFAVALQVIRPSLSKDQVKAFEDFTKEFGAM